MHEKNYLDTQNIYQSSYNIDLIKKNIKKLKKFIWSKYTMNVFLVVQNNIICDLQFKIQIKFFF